MLKDLFIFSIFIGKIVFFILGTIFILLILYFLYDSILYTFKNKRKKGNNIIIEDNIINIELELGIKDSIEDWNLFQKYILKLEKEKLGNFFYESYEIENLLFKYNQISFITLKLFSEILIGTNFVGKLEEEYIIKIKKLFKESKKEKVFIDKLKNNKKLWKFIKNNLVFNKINY